MSDYYVVLTGAIDNAGDFLIRDRAIRLLQRFRPDRDICEYSRRDGLDDERLETVNGSKALILAGGPSVQRKMYPGVFPLRPNLDEIRVPIVLYGAGWKGGGGSWRHEKSYQLSDASQSLLRRIARDGYPQSVRDFYTCRLLARYGVTYPSVTGCPALYGPFVDGNETIAFCPPPETRRIAVSTGVKFVAERRLEEQLLELLHAITSTYPASELSVVFHHSIDSERRRAAYGSTREESTARYQRLVSRIRNESPAVCAFVGGGLDGLTSVYESADLHVGYRVHAHVYMTSIGKPSYLLSEDGRGISMGQMIGPERTVVAMESGLGTMRRIGRRLKLSPQGLVNADAVTQVMTLISLDQANDWCLSRHAVGRIGLQFQVMQSFLQELP